MVAELKHACVDPACARPFPRAVGFCPFCGRAQRAGAPAPADEAGAPDPAAQADAWLVKPVTQAPAAAGDAPARAQAHMPPDAAPPAPPSAPPKPAPATGAAKPRPPLFGRKPLRIPELGPGINNGPSAAVGPRPIKASTWMLVLLALGGVWLFAKPDGADKALDERVERALAFSASCRLSDAREELIELKSAKAKPEQLKRLHKAIVDAAPGCDRQRARAKAWNDAAAMVEQALAAGNIDKAVNWLDVFTRRWGDDAASRALAERAAAQRGTELLKQADDCLSRADRVCLENRLKAVEKLRRPELAARIATLRAGLSHLLEATVPGAPDAGAGADRDNGKSGGKAGSAPDPRPLAAPLSTAPSPQAAAHTRALLAEGRQHLARGDYKNAIAKLDQCAAVLDSGDLACLKLKRHAEQLQRDMLRCLSVNAQWIDDRCQ
ncbi:MAG: hypothetical protein V4754_19225 [Pseudomonadota bacterium]